jgi:hypothetical protein
VNVNIAFRFFVVLLTVHAALPAVAQSWTFDLPQGWRLEWEPNKDDKSMPLDAILTSSKEKIYGRLFVRQGPKSAAFTPEAIESAVQSMAEATVPQSSEGRAEVRSFGPGNAGRYIRLTDKDGKAEFKYTNNAILRRDLTVMVAVLLSNDDDASALLKLFKIMDSVVMEGSPAAVPKAPVSNAAAKAQKPAAAQGMSWGAIATDAKKGEKDPDVGIGGGDTQAEAEQNALKFCREAGAKQCTLRLVYNQCGAYAQSDVGAGTGIAATKKGAEKQALSACKGSCEIVTSDCN